MERMLIMATPVGEVGIVASEEAVTRIFFVRGNCAKSPAGAAGTAAPVCCTTDDAPPLLLQAARELREYFAGERREFTFPAAPAGTEFQRAVWSALQRIPYGQTRSYKQVAQLIGRPAACRAVGMANNRNPIPIVIPCHRVVGAGGALVGYAAGLAAKSRLLEIEKNPPGESERLFGRI